MEKKEFALRIAEELSNFIPHDIVIEKLQIFDSDNYYFYICKSDTVAFEDIMLCARKYGSINKMRNLLAEDASVNYQLIFSKSTERNIISFVFGLIMKSHVLYPVIMGCPIHDVMEVLYREERENLYSLPPHQIDEISIQNIIRYIKQKYKVSSNGEIANLLCSTYGTYSIAKKEYKYWLYYHDAELRCEYLPNSMKQIIGKDINGHYVRSLDKSTLKAKWKSEELLYRLIYTYYPDTVEHFTAPWLGAQHIDVFIPQLMIGVEYQGQQHYEAIDFFGGAPSFEDRKLLDIQKKRLCYENDVLLIEWPYSYPVTAINLIYILQKHGINEIPVPDPFRILLKKNGIKKETAKD